MSREPALGRSQLASSARQETTCRPARLPKPAVENHQKTSGAAGQPAEPGGTGLGRASLASDAGFRDQKTAGSRCGRRCRRAITKTGASCKGAFREAPPAKTRPRSKANEGRPGEAGRGVPVDKPLPERPTQTLRGRNPPYLIEKAKNARKTVFPRCNRRRCPTRSSSLPRLEQRSSGSAST